MNKQQKFSGPRCAGCGRPFEPRQLRDGNWSQTCGQTACVAMLNRKRSSSNYTFDSSSRRRPQRAW
ncbi:MAG TPA: hypothetical protein VH186_02955 [Chloroflexia bacterium]|nr:hypothetical protein [Chloroflexia bacterium]